MTPKLLTPKEVDRINPTFCTKFDVADLIFTLRLSESRLAEKEELLNEEHKRRIAYLESSKLLESKMSRKLSDAKKHGEDWEADFIRSEQLNSDIRSQLFDSQASAGKLLKYRPTQELAAKLIGLAVQHSGETGIEREGVVETIERVIQERATLTTEVEKEKQQRHAFTRDALLNGIRVFELTGQLKECEGWHKVVVECEQVLKLEGTAESPLQSNLTNEIRDVTVEVERLKASVRDHIQLNGQLCRDARETVRIISRLNVAHEKTKVQRDRYAREIQLNRWTLIQLTATEICTFCHQQKGNAHKENCVAEETASQSSASPVI